MLGYVVCNSSQIFFFKFSILIHGKERPAQTKLFPAKLRAVLLLDTFGLSENLIVNFAQCQPARSHLFRGYIRENEFLREIVLTCLSGARWVGLMK